MSSSIKAGRARKIVMSLQDDSTALRKELEAEIGDKINFLDCEIEALLQSGIIKNSLQVGQKAPDFTLPNAIGGEVSLSSLLKKGPVVLSFYRGDPATLSTDLSALLIAHSACNVRFEEPYEFDCVGR